MSSTAPRRTVRPRHYGAVPATPHEGHDRRGGRVASSFRGIKGVAFRRCRPQPLRRRRRHCHCPHPLPSHVRYILLRNGQLGVCDSTVSSPQGLTRGTIAERAASRTHSVASRESPVDVATTVATTAHSLSATTAVVAYQQKRPARSVGSARPYRWCEVQCSRG